MKEQFDAIKNPKHYSILDGVESIQIIASAMTVDEWRGFCLGNIIKYRLRAGNKDKLEQDIGKADYYKELFEKHKHMCRGCADKPVINIEVGGPVPPGAE